jgi:hypothetical protein
MRLGGATRGKWRLLAGKVESSLFSYLRTDRLAPVNKIDYVLAHMRFMGPANLVYSTVTELDDTPLYFTDDIGIVLGPPTDYPSRFLCGRRH